MIYYANTKQSGIVSSLHPDDKYTISRNPVFFEVESGISRTPPKSQLNPILEGWSWHVTYLLVGFINTTLNITHSLNFCKWGSLSLVLQESPHSTWGTPSCVLSQIPKHSSCIALAPCILNHLSFLEPVSPQRPSTASFTSIDWHPVLSNTCPFNQRNKCCWIMKLCQALIHLILPTFSLHCCCNKCSCSNYTAQFSLTLLLGSFLGGRNKEGEA